MRGFRGLNPKQLERMFKQVGMDVENIDDVYEVIIKTPSRHFVFTKPKVTMIAVKGERTYQIIGEPNIVPAETTPEEESVDIIPHADIELVMSQTQVSYEVAKKTLEECKGDIAEAILKIRSCL